MNEHLNFIAFFIQKEKREEVLSLYDGFYRLVGMMQKISEPMIGQIKLAWWREMLSLQVQRQNLEEWMKDIYKWGQKTPAHQEALQKFIDALEEDFILAPNNEYKNVHLAFEAVLRQAQGENLSAKSLRYIEIEKRFAKPENSKSKRLRNILWAYGYYLGVVQL